jgi:hypothetical protein
MALHALSTPTVWLPLMMAIVATSVLATASPTRLTPTMERVSFIQVAAQRTIYPGAAALPTKTRCSVAAENETYNGL